MQVSDPETAKLCEARQILNRVGDKWSISVVYSLGKETRRFTELRREIHGISQRMLTATLRTLERDGLVRRTVHPVVPPRVDYELTDLGHTLHGTIRTLMRWALDHADDIAGARAAYDARPGDSSVSAPTRRG